MFQYNPLPLVIKAIIHSLYSEMRTRPTNTKMVLQSTLVIIKLICN